MRNKLSLLLGFLFIIFSTGVSALESTKERAVQLGDLEVTGEVRKPLIQVLDSEKESVLRLRTLAKKQLLRLEQQALAEAEGSKE